MGQNVTIVNEMGSAIAECDLIASKLASYARAAVGALSPNTERALRADVSIFTAWCAGRDIVALPASPETVAAFVDDMAAAKRATATIRRYVASIAHLHRAADAVDPTKTNVVRLAMKRTMRTLGTRQRQAAPLDVGAAERIQATTPLRPQPVQKGTHTIYVESHLTGLRDVAMVLTARDLLARRSELVALLAEDILPAEDGAATIVIRRSKTDQEGAGTTLWLSPKTTRAVRNWLEEAQITSGPIFRRVLKGGHLGTPLDAGSVSAIFKKVAERAGLESADQISGHSARVGMAQDLVACGSELPAVMQAGRWKSPTMPARYAERLMAGRGAVADFHRRRGR